jgi:hypothetical protein
MQTPGLLRSRGQAIVWLLATLAASAAVMLAVFNTSQITVGKQRAVNAADAAALAGATSQARLLNLVAYTNRGMIANEVFVAQMLSLESWLQYVEKSSGNIGTILDVISLIPPAAPFVKPVATVFDKISTIAGKGHDLLIKANDGAIKALELAKKALSAAQGAIHLGGGLLAEDVAKSIVNANRTTFGARHDPGITMADTLAVSKLTFMANQKDWLEFMKQYSGNERTDARQILLDSRDGFTANRPGTWLFNVDAVVTGLEKRGGSDIKKNGSSIAGFDRWETQDTLEQWNKVPCKSGFCKKYIPVGWGRSNADNAGSKGYVWAPNRTAQSWARSDGQAHSGWSGVPALYDVKDKTKAAREGLGLDFLVAVSRAGSADMSSQSLGMGGALSSPLGEPNAPLKQHKDLQAAMAKARVFFERPRRGLFNDFTASGLVRPDSAKEYGSLFSPYWQARLRDVSPGEKVALAGAMGLTPDYVKYTPGGQ